MIRLVVIAALWCLVTFYVLVPAAWRPAVLAHLELLAYDLRMATAAYLTYGNAGVVINPQVVVVDIDNQSLEKIGRWPWSRNTFATLINQLQQVYAVESIGLDVLFADETCQADADDTALIRALQAHLPVMAVSFQSQEGATLLRSGQLGKGVQLLGIDANAPWWGTAQGYIANLAKFLTENSITGHILPQRDLDGKVRRLKLVYQWNGQFYDTLSLAMLRQRLQAQALSWQAKPTHWLDSQQLILRSADAGVELRIPANAAGEVLIPYTQYRDYSAYQRIPAYKVLQGDQDIDLWGKYVLIGSSATGQTDIVASPLNPALPGVEVHASLLAALLSEQPVFKVEPYYEAILQIIVLLLIAIALLWSRRFGIWAVLAAGPVLLLLWISTNVILWMQMNLAVAILPPILLSVCAVAYLVISDMLDIQARHQYIKRLFSYYLPAPVAQRLANDRRNQDWLKAERREMTVLFADIQGFTTLADAMQPEEVAAVTWELFSALTEVIHAHGGTVDKYMGDAVMAFWGAPLDDPHHAQHAIDAAQAMQNSVAHLNQTTFSRKNLSIHLGIGINTGIMVVGNLGSAQRHTYTVMGSEVNKASAIQQLTREQGYAILVGENTAAHLPRCASLDLGLLGSKKLPYKLRVFAVLGH